jgi:alkylated DNA repair dioxygenase AlkB
LSGARGTCVKQGYEGNENGEVTYHDRRREEWLTAAALSRASTPHEAIGVTRKLEQSASKTLVSDGRVTPRLPLAHGAWLEHEPAWLPPAQADALWAAVLTELTWEQREIVLFGRRVLQPRLIAWAGALGYRYSGQTLPPRPFTPAVERLRAAVAARAGVTFNHVLGNRYRDGQDSMGFHADAEPELGADPVVATVSLGAARRFVIKPRKPADGEPLALLLGHGGLLIMAGPCQRHYVHGVPRQAQVDGERISLTFRRVERAPEL